VRCDGVDDVIDLRSMTSESRDDGSGSSAKCQRVVGGDTQTSRIVSKFVEKLSSWLSSQRPALTSRLFTTDIQPPRYTQVGYIHVCDVTTHLTFVCLYVIHCRCHTVSLW